MSTIARVDWQRAQFRRCPGADTSCAAEGSYACGAHAAKTADQKGRGHLLDTQDRGRTGVWTNQRGARLPTLSLAWTEEGTRGVGDRLSHAQHSEVTSALLWIEEEDKQARKLYT